MPELTQIIAEWCAATIELFGIGVITATAVYALAGAGVRLLRRESMESIFAHARERLVRGILLGLELLIAADIIHTVAVQLTFESVALLAAIVLIRTFLSIALEAELSGRMPWQRPK